jgi:hypothetical protein
VAQGLGLRIEQPEEAEDVGVGEDPLQEVRDLEPVRRFSPRTLAEGPTPARVRVHPGRQREEVVGVGRRQLGADQRAVRPVYAVYPSRRGLSAKVRVFVDGWRR